MPTSIAAVHPATQPIRHYSDHDNPVPDVPEYAFSELWQDKKEGLSFGDFLDIINPLQHIPVVSTIYRMVTGDEIGVGSRLAGGALFGGPLGAAAAGVVAIFEGASGKTVEQHVAALFDEGTEGQPGAVNVAAAAPAQATPAAAPDEKAALSAMPPDADTVEAAPLAQRAPEAAAPAAIAMTQAAAPSRVPPAPITAPQASAAARAPDQAAGTTAQQTAEARAAERQRIATAIEQAQRAQAGLLLASLQADDSASRLSGAEKDAEDDGPGIAPGAAPSPAFRAHPYMLPPGAPPHLISRAMEQALNRYQSAIQQRNAGTTAATPRTAPAPVR